MISKLPIYFWFELVAFIVSIFTILRANSSIRLFVPYLLLIVIFEYGSWYDWFMINGSNLWSINIIIIIEFIFFCYIFYQAGKTRRLIRVIQIGAPICLMATAVNMLFVQGLWKLNSYSYLLMSLFFMIAIWIYFVSLLNEDANEIILLVYDPYFWIATGLMFFYSVGFVFFSFFEYMAYRNDFTYSNIFDAISSASIIILYSCLSISFICYKRMQK